MPSREANSKGRATAFAILTPFRGPWTRRLAAAAFPALQLAQREDVARALATLHFAYWAILRPPALHGAGPSGTDQMLFISVFDGDWEQYIDAFSRVIPNAMDRIWGLTENWPGARRFGAFIDHIRQHQLISNTFFNAYEDADVEEIRASLRVSDGLDRFRCETSGASDGRFRMAYDHFLQTYSADLGS